MIRFLVGWLAMMLCMAVYSQNHAHHHHHHGMQMNRDGMVMHENHENLPKDCDVLGGSTSFEVRVGTKYAEPGFTFGYNQYEFIVPACSKITVTFVNEDAVRHQWMVHGLPKYLYPQGMFHMEVNGGKSVTGTFIVPSDDATYLVHCDMAHHMEKGLKAQLVVGRGNGDLPNVPTVSNGMSRDRY
ncbi:MAG: hypothetical protein ACU84Q_10030 [Gammaproteobacteria bacterium]